MMKTFAIELQRLHAMSNGHGVIELRLDAAVQPSARRSEESEPATTLSMTVENARVLALMLKAQLAEIDARKARSQR